MISLSRRVFLLACAGLAALPDTPVEAAPADPVAFVNALVQQALAVLRNKQLPDDARERRFKTMLDKDFDMPRIGRFVLGRYWLAASDNDRKTFNTLFAEWVVKIYSVQLKNYGGDTVKVTGSRAESPTSYAVSSQLIRISGAPPITIYWHVRKSGDDLKIVDVEIADVSMALVERQEIASVIERNGGSVASLNQTLKDKLDGGKTTASGSNGS